MTNIVHKPLHATTKTAKYDKVTATIRGSNLFYSYKHTNKYS